MGVWVLARGLVWLGCLPSLPVVASFTTKFNEICFYLALHKWRKKTTTVLDRLLLHFGGEPEGSLGGLEWREPSFLTMLCSCYLSDDETFALGDGGLKG